jgi:hypothetical protein
MNEMVSYCKVSNPPYSLVYQFTQLRRNLNKQVYIMQMRANIKIGLLFDIKKMIIFVFFFLFKL